MNIIIEYDDFHWEMPENCLSSIYKIISEFPGIKISLFTIPFLRKKSLYEDRTWCRKVGKLIESGHIEIERHGFLHSTLEFKSEDLIYIREAILLGDSILAKSGLISKKVFRGPYWGISSQAINILNDLGYTHLYNHVDYSHLDSIFKNKVVYYNWNLADESPQAIDPGYGFIVAHGHTHNVCNNGIEESMNRLRDFIYNNDVTFKFASEI